MTQEIKNNYQEGPSGSSFKGQGSVWLLNKFRSS